MVSIFISKGDRYDPRESWENRYRDELRKIVDALSDKLGKRGAKDIEATLKNLFKLTDWLPNVGSVGIFRGPELSGYLKLPLGTGNFHVVSDRFHLAPLYQWFVLKNRYYLLNLGSSEATLFRGSDLGLEQLESISLPKFSKGCRDPIALSFEKLNLVCLKHLHGETAPLVLSGIESHQAVFRGIAGYPYVESQGLPIASQNLRSRPFLSVQACAS